MKRLKFENLTVNQLVERFVAIALDQDEAIFMHNNAKFNRLFEQMDAIKQELASRAGDQRRELIPLHGHPNAQVRLKSAIATLALAPAAARRTLQIISDRQEYPQAVDARGMMSALDEGRFIPS
jgi:hypothetical protein